MDDQAFGACQVTDTLTEEHRSGGIELSLARYDSVGSKVESAKCS